MRGANTKTFKETLKIRETSPHAWSKLSEVLQTSSSTEKHLHMRGANPLVEPKTSTAVETSPHAWSKPLTRQNEES